MSQGHRACNKGNQMTDEKQKMSFQTIVYIVIGVLCFLFFFFSAMSANRGTNPNYQDIKPAPTK
jgi:hypothetical protein